MPNEVIILLGAIIGTLIGALAAYITARVTTKKQLEIAQLNAEKDLKLQEELLFEERLKSEVSLERSKLETLHMILSRIALENSLTMSYMQSDSDMGLEEFRKRYLDNCFRLHEARAIVDIYYPEMSNSVRIIYGQSNMFWGHQEGVLRSDRKKDASVYHSHLDDVVKVGNEIEDNVRRLQGKISVRGEELDRALHRAGH